MADTVSDSERAVEVPVLEPTSEGQLRDMILAEVAGDPGPPARPLIPRGLGSSMAWCRPTRRPGARFVSTRSLVPSGSSGIVEYVPGDGTLTALAGARMSDLRAAVAEGGHELTPCIAGDSTLGGVLAAGRSGPDRMGFGPARHHVLGMQIIDGTGRITRSGGRLVKNVTGFDMHRLHVGARGTLGIVLEASLRLMPKAEAEVFAVSQPHASTALAVEAALRVRALSSVKPRALFVRGPVVHVLLAGRSAQLEIERTAVEYALGSLAESTDEAAIPRMLSAAAAGVVALRITTAPSRVVGVLQEITDRLGDGVVQDAYVEPDAAIIDLDASAISSDATTWATTLLPGFDRGAVHVEPREQTPATIVAACNARLVVPPPAAVWTRRLIDSFDPSGLFQTPHFPAATDPAPLHG